MSLTPELIHTKFQSLNETQEAIQSVSSWVVFHRRSAAQIVKIWSQTLANASPQRRLLLIYLANDVCQQSRARKRDEFPKEFAKVVPGAVGSACVQLPDELQKKVKHVVDVWRQRNIFPPEVVQDTEAQMARAKAKRGSTGVSAAVPRDLEKLLECYHILDSPKQKALDDTLQSVQEQYRNLFEAEGLPGPIEFNERLEELLKAISQIQKDLEQSSRSRTEAIGSLEQLLSQHKSKLENEQTSLADIKAKQEQTLQTKKEIDEILQEDQDAPMQGQSNDDNRDAPVGNSGTTPPGDPPEVDSIELPGLNAGSKPSKQSQQDMYKDSLSDMAELDPEIQALISGSG